jgi:hypothetical protein
MRFLISARVPAQKTNALIQEGRFPQTFQSIMEDLQPEAAHFTTMDGARGAYFVVNVDEPSETEPFCKGWAVRMDTGGCARGDASIRASGTEVRLKQSRRPAQRRSEGKRGLGPLHFGTPAVRSYASECVEGVSPKFPHGSFPASYTLV